MRIIPLQRYMIGEKAVNFLDGGVQFQFWQLFWGASELFVHLIDVVGVDMNVAEAVHEIAHFEVADLSYHVS